MQERNNAVFGFCACMCSSRRHLWVSGTGGSLSKAIKAIDLKDFFSKYGKVGVQQDVLQPTVVHLVMGWIALCVCVFVYPRLHIFCQVVSATIVAPKSRYYPPKMYGFVTMKTEKEAELCIRELNLREVKGQKLLIEIVSHPIVNALPLCYLQY